MTLGAGQRWRLGVLILGVAALSLGCASAPAAAQRGDASTAASGDDAIVAVIDGVALTRGELDRELAPSLARERVAYEDRIYELRRRALDERIDRELLEDAARRLGHADVDALLTAEVADRTPPPTRGEVAAFYEEHEAEFDGQPLDELAEPIAEYLHNQAMRRRFIAWLDELRDRAGVEIRLEAPRIAVAPAGPSRGPEDAAVIIVMFSDYHCGHCRAAYPTIDRILAAYPEQVRFVHRHFPLGAREGARLVAHATVCAEEQGRFWELHDRLLREDRGLDRAALDAAAASLEGLDVRAFRVCLDSGRALARVEEDVDAGGQAAVTGTPAFFVNGIRLAGARPFEEFVAVIEGELRRLGATR